jgi:hypothetical protein
MTCPKCRARIGIQQQQLATVFGQAVGVRCFICGFWVQEFPSTVHRGTPINCANDGASL